ncbi:MAG: IS1595-like element ISPlba2 family transposase, partial [Nitrospira sp.]
HNVASLLKRWLIGTHQGGIQHQQIDYYLDEFTFRFNRRRSQARGLLYHETRFDLIGNGFAECAARSMGREGLRGGSYADPCNKCCYALNSTSPEFL